MHACFIILLKKGIHIEVPECVCHLRPWIGRLKDWHIQSRRCQPLLLPTPSAAPVSMPMACGLTHSGVTIGFWCPSVRGGGRQTPLPTTVHWDLGGLLHGHAAPVWEVSLASATSSTPEALLACCGALPTSLARGVRLPCIHDWNVMAWVLSPAPQPSAVGGSNRLPPCLHQREEANGEVGRARDPL